jgi:hypothetical protein
MPLHSTVMVQNPVNAEDLFAAARRVVHPRQSLTWHLCDYDTIHMLQADTNQGADALVSVHFPPGGGPYPREDDPGQPAGYALVMFSRGCQGSTEEDRPSHERLVAGLGDWLTARSLRWSWSYEGGRWEPGGQDS